MGILLDSIWKGAVGALALSLAAGSGPAGAADPAAKPGGKVRVGPVTTPDASPTPTPAPSGAREKETAPPSGRKSLPRGTEQGLGTAPGQQPAMGAARRTLHVMPKLEVRAGSGDFTAWKNTVVIDASQVRKPVDLRWHGPAFPVAEARWILKRGAPNATSRNATQVGQGPVGAIPGAGQTRQFSVIPERTRGDLPNAARYFVQLELLDADGAKIGTSTTATIDYKSSIAQKFGQTISADLLTVNSVTPSSGNVTGAPPGAKSGFDKVKVQIGYELNTDPEGLITAILVDANGASPVGVKHVLLYVDKGKGQVEQRVWWQCKPGGPNHAFTAIKYRMSRKGSNVVLYEGKHALPAPLVFDCGSTQTAGLPPVGKWAQLQKGLAISQTTGSDIEIKAMTPLGGEVEGMRQYPQWKAGNHIVLTYEYTLGGYPSAKISQYAQNENGNVIPGNNWTLGTANGGSGTSQTKLTLRCDGEFYAPSREVSEIRYKLWVPDGPTLAEKVLPVNFTFTCPTRMISPRSN